MLQVVRLACTNLQGEKLSIQGDGFQVCDIEDIGVVENTIPAEQEAEGV